MEIKKLFLKEEDDREKLKENISKLLNNESIEAKNLLMKEALKLVIVNYTASTSFLQRRLGIGFSRAALLIDDMEKLNYISAADGSKPRKVFITREDFEKIYGEKLPYVEVLYSDEIQKKEELKKKNNEERKIELFKEAVKFVILFNKVNASSLQRRFGIGFFKATQIIDKMEKLNYISPLDENRKRTINITLEEFEKKYEEQNELN